MLKNRCPVFDAHTYMDRLHSEVGFGVPRIVDGQALVELMDQAGIDKAVAMATGASRPDYAKGNELVAQGVRGYPTRIYGLARVNPHYRKGAAESLEYWIRERGLCGLKLNGMMEGFVVNDRELVWPLMEKAEELGIPVFFHSESSWPCSPGLIADLAMDFPGVSIIAAHMGEYQGHAEAIAFAKRVKNLYLDTAGFGRPPHIRRAVEKLGAEKVLFGSNGPNLPFQFEVEKIVRYAHLSDEELRLVMGGNIARLLGVRLQ